MIAVRDRVELVHTDDPFTRLRPGSMGTVMEVIRNPVGPGLVYEISWDSGSHLSMIEADGDRIQKVR